MEINDNAGRRLKRYRKFVDAADFDSVIDFWTECQSCKTYKMRMVCTDPKLGEAVYKLLTCLICYNNLIHDKGELTTSNGLLLVPRNGSSIYNETEAYYADVNDNDTVRNVCRGLRDNDCDRWKSCCAAAENCCTRHKSMSNTSSNPLSTFCPKTWDSFSCIDDTRNGTIASFDCPAYLHEGKLYTRFQLFVGLWNKLIQETSDMFGTSSLIRI